MNETFKPIINIYSTEYLQNLSKPELIKIIINLQKNR